MDGPGKPHICTNVSPTGLLGEAAGGVWRVFSGTDIDIDHKKKVDLGVLRDAECNGRVAGKPFSTVRGASVMVKLR